MPQCFPHCFFKRDESRGCCKPQPLKAAFAFFALALCSSMLASCLVAEKKGALRRRKSCAFQTPPIFTATFYGHFDGPTIIALADLKIKAWEHPLQWISSWSLMAFFRNWSCIFSKKDENLLQITRQIGNLYERLLTIFLYG